MTMKYLNTVLFSNTEFYNKYAIYMQMLKKHNITTVGQLVDDNIMAPIIVHAHHSTKIQLQVLISLLKYVYLNEPLDIMETLNKKLYITSYQSYGVYQIYFYLDEQHIDDFRLYNFVGVKHYDIDDLLFLLGTDFELKDLIVNSDFKVIDLLEWIVNNYSEAVTKYKATIDTYIKFYKNNKKMKLDVADESIESLRNNITKLVKQKDDIDIQIVAMQRQLDAKIKTLV